MTLARGVIKSQRRAESLRRQRERLAAADIRRPDPRFHLPSAGENGTVKCSCSGAPFSPQAFQRHVAGEAARDILHGVYIVGTHSDAWALEQGRRGDDEPKEQRWDGGEAFTDGAGSQWRAFEDEFQRRAWRCIAGPRIGEVALDTRLVALPPERTTQSVGGYVDEPF